MKTKIIFVILFGFIISGCKKTDPVIAPSNTPVFYFNGTINGAQTKLQAGVNNYYMFTSYALDANGVYDFMGELKNYSCPTYCNGSLKISIKDYRKYAVAPTSIDSAIFPGYYSFATPAGTSSQFYVPFKDTLYNGIGQTYQWDFGDGTTSNQHLPSHVYSHPGIYPVSLTVQSGTCSSSLSNDVMIGQVGNPILMAVAGTPTANVVGFVSSVGGGAGTFTYNWDFGDGNTVNTGTVSSTTHTYSSGVYASTLSVTDAANTTAVCHTNVGTQSAATCYMNFYPSFITQIPNPTNLSNVTIEWRDAGGTLYTSADNNQPNKSMFKIISVDNYQNNSAGQATKKIHAKITCTLYNSASSSSVVLDGDVVFSVAHL
jgi:PKD repeat protein